jgi:hypothetical protein
MADQRSAVQLQTAIAAADEAYDEQKQRERRALQEEEEAEERQRLRRVLEEKEALVDHQRYLSELRESHNRDIDADDAGPYEASSTGGGHCTRQPRPAQKRRQTIAGSVSRHDARVVKKEYEWKVTGMSWLVTSLRQVEDTCAASKAFRVSKVVGDEVDLVEFEEKFALVYNPRCERLELPRLMKSGSMGCARFYGRGEVDEDSSEVRGSLALACSRSYVTLRHTFFIKRTGGDFVQWGDTVDDVLRNVELASAPPFFGPDVHPPNSAVGVQPAERGIFGMTHKELLQSEWVENDAMTVKVVIECRRGGIPQVSQLEYAETEAPRVAVPEGRLSGDFLAVFESGKNTDVTFNVSGEQFEAHFFVLSTRSCVLDRELSCGMQESESREVTIDDCSPAAFRAMLQFLYTDDFAHVEVMVQVQSGVCIYCTR